MVERKEYLDQLWAWKDERQIKVVTGIRRCGKSVLLEQYQQRLLANGVAPEQIISINFENLDYEPLKDYMRLYNYLKERLCVDKMTYIFLDEVQEVPSFEKVVDSLYIRDHVDVYITGSNAYMHYPVFCYNGQFRRGADGTPLTYMLHGHIHKSEDQVLVDRFSTETRAMMRKSAHQETAQPVPCQMINCFCMYSDYTPLTLEEWVECDQRRRDKADR